MGLLVSNGGSYIQMQTNLMSPTILAQNSSVHQGAGGAKRNMGVGDIIVVSVKEAILVVV